MGLYGSRRGRDDRVGLGSYPEPGRRRLPREPYAPPRCALDSDWCDGKICEDHGIDCPRARRAAVT